MSILYMDPSHPVPESIVTYQVGGGDKKGLSKSQKRELASGNVIGVKRGTFEKWQSMMYVIPDSFFANKTVYLGFQTGLKNPPIEWMWVNQVKRIGEGKFSGKLDNAPIWVKKYKLGSTVKFKKSEIASFYDKNDPTTKAILTIAILTGKLEFFEDWHMKNTGKVIEHFSKKANTNKTKSRKSIKRRNKTKSRSK